MNTGTKPKNRQVRNCALIGYRGTGKSSIAGKLAARLGWNWIDADEELERRAQQTIAEIFAKDGEAYFRKLEAALLAELVQKPDAVLALGGGVVLLQQNRDVLREVGCVVWLQAQPETLLARIAGDPSTATRRPQLSTHGGRAEIEQLLAQRTPWYRECASLVMNTDGRDLDSVVDDIFEQLPQAMRNSQQSKEG